MTCTCPRRDYDYAADYDCPEHGYCATLGHPDTGKPGPAGCRCGARAAPPADTEMLREALRAHHPIMRSETGPFSGCRCGRVKIGQDVIAHVVTELRAALDAR